MSERRMRDSESLSTRISTTGKPSKPTAEKIAEEYIRRNKPHVSRMILIKEAASLFPGVDLAPIIAKLLPPEEERFDDPEPKKREWRKKTGRKPVSESVSPKAAIPTADTPSADPTLAEQETFAREIRGPAGTAKDEENTASDWNDLPEAVREEYCMDAVNEPGCTIEKLMESVTGATREGIAAIFQKINQHDKRVEIREAALRFLKK